MTESLAGKAALITGSTRRGIGAATALALALEGASIILNYGTGGKSSEARGRAEELTDKIRSLGANVALIAAAVQSEDEVKEMFRQAKELFGGIDILVNNAGGAWLEQDFAAIDTQHWNQAIRSEIDGTFFCIRESLPHMRDKHWGRVINVCLDEATMQLLINAQYGHVLEKYPYDFSLAKFTKREITKLLAFPEFKYGITINNILPGIIEDVDHDAALARLRLTNDNAIYFDPVDVARAIVFLCREDARGITQSDIRIPGNIYQRL